MNPVSKEGPLCSFILNPVRPDEVVDGGEYDVDDGDRCEDKNSRYVEKETEQKGTFDNCHSYRADHSLRPLRVKKKCIEHLLIFANERGKRGDKKQIPQR